MNVSGEPDFSLPASHQKRDLVFWFICNEESYCIFRCSIDLSRFLSC